MDTGFQIATMLIAAGFLSVCLVRIATVVWCGEYIAEPPQQPPPVLNEVAVQPAWMAVEHPAGEVVVGEKL